MSHLSCVEVGLEEISQNLLQLWKWITNSKNPWRQQWDCLLAGGGYSCVPAKVHIARPDLMASTGISSQATE